MPWGLCSGGETWEIYAEGYILNGPRRAGDIKHKTYRDRVMCCICMPKLTTQWPSGHIECTKRWTIHKTDWMNGTTWILTVKLLPKAIIRPVNIQMAPGSLHWAGDRVDYVVSLIKLMCQVTTCLIVPQNSVYKKALCLQFLPTHSANFLTHFLQDVDGLERSMKKRGKKLLSTSKTWRIRTHLIT